MLRYLRESLWLHLIPNLEHSTRGRLSLSPAQEKTRDPATKKDQDPFLASTALHSLPNVICLRPMFNKPLVNISPLPFPSESPSPPSVSDPVSQPNGTDPTPNPAISPPSPKRQKMAAAPAPVKTPAKTPGKTPGKPRQSLLTPYSVGGGKRMAFKPATSTGKSSAAKKGGNTSILSFFKPAAAAGMETPVRGAAKGGKVVGAQSDDLFIRHGGYELDLSEPEEEDEGDESAWSVERALAGELELAKRDDDLYSSPVRVKHGHPGPPLSGRDEEYDEDDVVMSENVVDEIESTAPTTDISPGNSTTTTGAETSGSKVSGSAPKFNPASLKLDGASSFLFSNKGSIPAPFKKLRGSPSNSSPGETNFNDQESEETGPVDDRTNRSIGESIVGRTEEAGAGGITAKRTREQAFMKEPTEMLETSGSSPTKEEEDGGDTTDAPPPGAEEKLEACNIIPKARRREGSAFEEEEYEDIEDFSEELNFEEQEAYRFDPASRAEAGYEDFDGNLEYLENISKTDEIEDSTPTEAEAVRCPICAINIGNLPENDKNDHVNHCLDGTPIPFPTPPFKPVFLPPKPGATNLASPFFGRAPVITPSSSSRPSAFTRLMSTNSESQAWASAAKAEVNSRGKKAADRTCPFYKILFNGPVTVDAFRYGAVPGCSAYFLSHFHSDHYIGLSSKWTHGPIYCSRITANLVRSRLGVDPKYVHELAWEEWTDFGVDGIRVRGLDANHCPGSMLFLFEETRKGGKRILHCGDFRARPEHLQHPLLAPGKEGLNGQKIDVIYLDTTYLNPKYAFPAQSSVIEACAAMSVKLQKEASTGISEPTHARKSTLTGFITPAAPPPTPAKKPPGRLLIIVGTYSIGKERLCLAIAQALNTKIFAPPNKRHLCHQLEDPLLDRLLTSNPREAQVHMTPLMDLQLPSLKEYLAAFRPHFDRIVGFRPSGWSYRPPNSRAVESTTVAGVLYDESWKSAYGLAQMAPVRGSSAAVRCYAVPYSEHSSFRELTMFCCALNVGRVVPTVNVGSAKSRGEMMGWVEKWEAEKRKSGLFSVEDGKGVW